MISSLKVSFGVKPTSGSSDSYWMFMELVDTSTQENASLGTIANILDEVYGTNPCKDEEKTEEEIEEDQEEPPVDEETFWGIINKYVDSSQCTDEDGKRSAFVRLFRNIPMGEKDDRSYTLRISIGEIQEEITSHSEEVYENVSLSKVDSYTPKYPVSGDVAASWSNGKAITIEDSSAKILDFGEEVSGTLILKYTTSYDLIHIKLDSNEDGSSDEALLLAFWKKLVADVDVSIPPYDDSIDSPLCRGYSAGSAEKKDDLCEVSVRVYDKCDCSETVMYTDIEEIYYVPCDEVWKYPRHKFRDYIDCGEVTGDMNTAEFYKETCCEPPPPKSERILPDCWRMYSTLKATQTIDKDKYKQYGDDVEFIPIGPSESYCGVWRQEWRKNARDCCGDVSQMYFSKFPSTVSQNSSYVIEVSGGAEPIELQVSSGSGAYIERISGREFRVSITDCFCLPAAVVAGDACNTFINGTLTPEASMGWWKDVTYTGEGADCPIINWLGTSFPPSRDAVLDSDDGIWRVVFDRSSLITGIPGCRSTPGEACAAGATTSNGNEVKIRFPNVILPPDPVPVSGYATYGYAWCSDGWSYTYKALKAMTWYCWWRDGVTNQRIYKWKCNDYGDLLWNQESALIISPNFYGLVGIIGGKAPYRVVINGNGFFFDSDLGNTQGVTSSLSFRIYTGNACGTAQIIVTDACGDEVIGEVQSTVVEC